MRQVFLFLAAACLFLPSFSELDAQEKRWAVVNLSSCFLRQKASYESPVEAQCLMGTVLEVKGKDRYWLKVDAPDYPNCWTNELAVVLMDEKEKEAYLASDKLIFISDFGHLYSEASFDSSRICDLSMGDILRPYGEVNFEAMDCGAWIEVLLPSGQKGWLPENCVWDYQDWAGHHHIIVAEANAKDGFARQELEQRIVSLARQFLGVPYMWGGNTAKYFDCSGLVKLVYMMNGIVLPRNSGQQMRCGEPVSFDLEQMRPGDLIFYGSLKADGIVASVSHVAIYIGDGRIIHSSQLVRINSLRPGDKDYYDRKPIGVRRIIGHVDSGKSATSIWVKPWYFGN